MKKFLSILLLLPLLLQQYQTLSAVLSYEVNKTYISKVLCENKDKPAMHCNGACHLKKELKEQEKKENQNPGSRSENEASVYIIPQNLIEAPVFRLVSEVYPHCYYPILERPSPVPFQPPCA